MIGTLRTALSTIRPRTVAHSTTESLLRPFLCQAQQCRSASILGALRDNPGAYNKKIRRGRGPSSGKGKTSGRGHKGQKQHGKVPAGFNGGQTSDYEVHGRRGFKNPFTTDLSPINLDRIQQWVDAGRLNPAHPITVKELCTSRCLHGVKEGVKLLARGSVALTSPIHIIVSRASDAAIEAVEKAGGSVTTRYYTKSSIKRIRQGQTHPYHSLRSKPMPFEEQSEAGPSSSSHSFIIPERLTKPYKYRLPDPISRKNLEYYRDAAHRGYLSHLVGEGKSPSLFFKSPTDKAIVKKPNKLTAAAKQAAEARSNTMW